MLAKYLSSLVIVRLAAGRDLRSTQTNSTTIASRVEDGIQTEGKTCPYELCTNHVAYLYDQHMTLTCWTYGDNIVDTNVWLKTTDGCYVTEWDLIDYAGDYTNTPGFPYCGYIPETITVGPSKTVYDTECNIIPELVQTDDHVKMYKPDVNLALTCVTSSGGDVLGNTTWYKTTSNCYVPQGEIGPVHSALDDCGPIPFMEKKMREPDPQPTPTPAFAVRDAEGPDSRRNPHDEQAAENNMKRWLYPTQINSVYSNCFSDPISDSKVEKVYAFGDYIVVQCATYGVKPEQDQIYLLTEYFCWVNNNLTNPQLKHDELRAERYPNCNLFTDTSV